MSYKGSIAEAFEHGDQGIYKGRLIHKYLEFSKLGYYKLDFKIIRKDSRYLQAIVLFLNDNFKGEFYINRKKEPKPKGRFPKITLWEDDVPEEFSVYVHIEEGCFDILNACRIPIEQFKFGTMLSGGCAIIIENLGEDHYRLNCNDADRDDDFNDFIFEVKFTEFLDGENWLKLAKQKG